jgi:ribosomal protein L7/L12
VEAIDPERSIYLCQLIRETTGMDLMDALSLVSRGGARRIAQVRTIDEANRIRRILEQAGATVEVYPSGQEFDL